MKNGAFKLEGRAQLKGICQIAVVGKRHSSLDMIDHNGLGVVSAVSAGGAVSDVADGNVSLTETVENFRRENVVHKTGVLIFVEKSVVVDHYSAGLLPSVLKSEKSVICVGGKIVGRF